VDRAFAEAEARHRLLEGFLLRLAGAPDAEAFVLRGGMLVHQWFPHVGRRARDIDLVCLLPHDPADLRQRLAAILADTRATDGVTFDAERFRIDPLWPDSPHPGLRLFASGRTDDGSGEVSVDLTFGLDVWPAAQRHELALDRGLAPLWVCRPEMLIGRKLRVTADLADRHWRPKDLADLWLMTRRGCPRGVLGEAIERTMPDVGEVAGLLDQPWWSEPRAATRWRRFGRGARSAVPDRLATVVQDVRAALAAVVGVR
jgi:hypothetical protein